MQTTILRPVSCYGITVHSGAVVQLTMRPAEADQGIVFVRTDSKAPTTHIEANYKNVNDTKLSTSIINSAGVSVSTIEHLMAAIWGCGIDNMIIELDGPEVPIMDGSSKPFLFLIECASIKKLHAPRKRLKLLREVAVSEQGIDIIASPSDAFEIDMAIDFPSKAIGKQQLSFTDQESFREQISAARTFGFIHDIEHLQSMGLAKGASIKNAIGIDKDQIINPEGLRFEDEFVRHKLLDAIGDFYTASNIIASMKCNKSGHYHNNMILHKILENPANFEWTT